MRLSNSVKHISYLKQHTAEVINTVHNNNEVVVHLCVDGRRDMQSLLIRRLVR